jgi:hypothetical protein
VTGNPPHADFAPRRRIERNPMHSEPHPAGDAGDLPQAARPLGFWLKTVDRLIATEFAAAFDDLDVTRREWRLLNLIAGDVRDERLTAELEARPHLVEPLVERGWVAGGPGDRRLTDDGRAALDSLGERVAGIRSRVAGAVPAEDYATTMTTLEAIARELGWNDGETRPGRRGGPRGDRGHRGHRYGWGHRREPGSGRRRDEVHVHVHVHGDRETRGEHRRHRGRRHGRGRCAHAAG